jgi:hypothetical protein
MRGLSVALLGLLVVASLPRAASAARCLGSGDTVAGELRDVRTRLADGRLIRSFHIVLPRSTCVVTDAGSTVPDVRSVEVAARTKTIEAEIAGKVGERVALSGRLGAVDRTRHSGDVVLEGASPVGLPSGSEEGVATEAAPAPPPDDQTAAEPAEPEATEPAAAPPATSLADLPFPEVERRLARFIEKFYLGPGALDADQIRTLYADSVDYYGRRLAVGSIVRDKLGYYGRWPKRKFRFDAATLDVRRAHRQGLYDAAFEYDFEVAGEGGLRRGRGLAILTFDFADSTGKIIRETGEVVARY